MRRLWIQGGNNQLNIKTVWLLLDNFLCLVNEYEYVQYILIKYNYDFEYSIEIR